MPTDYKDQVRTYWEPFPPLMDDEWASYARGLVDGEDYLERVQGLTCVSKPLKDPVDCLLVYHASPGILLRLMGCVAYDMARFVDGESLKRPDLLVSMCLAMQDTPSRLAATFPSGEGFVAVCNAAQRAVFADLLSIVIDSGKPILAGEVRTPWNDSDLWLFGNRLVGYLEGSRML